MNTDPVTERFPGFVPDGRGGYHKPAGHAAIAGTSQHAIRREEPVLGQRVRQEKASCNKLETEWGNWLKDAYPLATIRAQSFRVRIGNGAWYKIDHFGLVDGQWTGWECKGPKEMKGVAKGLLALKCAASTYPEIRWILVWKEDGIWKQQEIKP